MIDITGFEYITVIRVRRALHEAFRLKNSKAFKHRMRCISRFISKVWRRHRLFGSYNFFPEFNIAFSYQSSKSNKFSYIHLPVKSLTGEEKRRRAYIFRSNHAPYSLACLEEKLPFSHENDKKLGRDELLIDLYDAYFSSSFNKRNTHARLKFEINREDKGYLKSLISKCESFLTTELGLKLHPDKIVLSPCDYGAKFLGAIVKPYRRYCINRVYENYKEHLVASRDVASYIGYFSHFSSYSKIDSLF